MEDNQSVKAFYENECDENAREGRETIEFARSKNIISRYLRKKDMEIADVCGATGAYSFWLAAMGHRVHLLDLAPNHIETAKQKSRASGLALASYSCADARELPYDDNSMDLVLLMGALYHFRSPASRLRCLTEAYRVLRKGGTLLCTVLNRYNFLIASLKYKHLIERMGVDPIEKALSTGIIDNPAFTSLPLLYGHTPGEIVSELTTAGYKDIKLIAVEGIANALSDNQLPGDTAEAARLLRCVELLESVPELMGVSRNIIAAGTK